MFNRYVEEVINEYSKLYKDKFSKELTKEERKTIKNKLLKHEECFLNHLYIGNINGMITAETYIDGTIGIDCLYCDKTIY